MSESHRRRSVLFGDAADYRIVVQGIVSAEKAAYLAGMRVVATDVAAAVTVLVGRLRDQAALSGVLDMLYNLHLPIIEVKALDDEE